MRTTIELSDRHRSILHALASRRGLKGYSKIIQEAIDFYIKEKGFEDNTVQEILKLKGMWSIEEGHRIRANLKEIRENLKEI